MQSFCYCFVDVQVQVQVIYEILKMKCLMRKVKLRASLQTYTIYLNTLLSKEPKQKGPVCLTFG